MLKAEFMKRLFAKNRENLRFFLYMTITTHCQQGAYVIIGMHRKQRKTVKCPQPVVNKALIRVSPVLRCFQWNPPLHLWITDEDENGDFRANDNDWLIRILPRAFPQCLWQGKNHGLTRSVPGVGPKGRNRRHIVDYQALKVQHLAQHLCNRGATFCP